ncbi:MAG: hypothetical protein EBT18_08715 [Gammaproteobacteria bacterium]|nr:hypothetical protein [Gammaproteobacteria bacterium]
MHRRRIGCIVSGAAAFERDRRGCRRHCHAEACLGIEVRTDRAGRVFIYNVSDHQSCYREVNAQAVSYTTGVPAMIGAKQMLTGQWHKPGVFNMEELDPDPFMKDLNEFGLPWRIQELPCDGPSPLRS